MNCPHCGHDKSAVRDSREMDGYLRRRRTCQQCARRFTTYEVVGERPDRTARLWRGQVSKRDQEIAQLREQLAYYERLVRAVKAVVGETPLQGQW